MSFTRSNPAVGGWPYGGSWTSAQANSLDIDHSNALDKTVAGDSISGTVTFASGASFSSGVVGGVNSLVTSGIQSGVAGGIQLSGGAADWPTFSAARSRTSWYSLDEATIAFNQGTLQTVYLAPGTFPAPPSGFVPIIRASNFLGTVDASPAVGVKGSFLASANSGKNMSAPTSVPGACYYAPLTRLHNGSTITLGSMSVIGAATHAQLPQQLPQWGIWRFPTNTNPTGSPQPLLSGGNGCAIDTSATLGSFTAQHVILYTPNQNNVVDTGNFSYGAFIWDECGTNALGGNEFPGLQLTFSSINDLRFQ